jgi:Zn-dependent peptidase ImmA (M78 family)
VKEHGYVVQSRTTEAIANAAEEFLRRRMPKNLEDAHALDLAHLVDYGLQSEGILVYPVSTEELPDAEAETRAGEGQWLEIWMREEFYEALFTRNSNTNRARSTLAHEIGHAILHESEVRTGCHQPHVLALRRTLRSNLKPFQDSEWQAHTFAGALLMPRPALRATMLSDIHPLAELFEVSESFASSHLKRIRRLL